MKKFWYAEALCTGNTHWLNSLAIKCAILTGNENLIVIRWFSVLSSFIFCGITFTWIRSIKDLHLKVLIFAVVLCNPYILDYFSIARGYASGLMFQALGLLYFVRALQNHGKYFKFLALLFSGLSAISNFSYIYFFMAFCLVYFSYYYFRKGNNFFKKPGFYRDCFYSLAIALLVIRAFKFMTDCSNDVVGAGTEYFREYFHVFIDGLVYRKWPINIQQLDMLSYVVFTIILISFSYGIINRKKHNNEIYFYISCILAIIISVSLINHFVFGLVFPYYRSAVFLFPTSAACFIYFLYYSTKNFNFQKGLSYTISAVLILNMLLSINFKWVFDFYIQANLKDSFDELEKLQAKHVGISPELYGGYRNYYQMTWKYHYDFFGEPIHTNLPKGVTDNPFRLKEFDHIVLFPPYDLSYYKNNKVWFEAVKLFPETGTLILKVQ